MLSLIMRELSTTTCQVASVLLLGGELLPTRSPAAWRKALLPACGVEFLGLNHCIISLGLSYYHAVLLEIYI